MGSFRWGALDGAQSYTGYALGSRLCALATLRIFFLSKPYTGRHFEYESIAFQKNCPASKLIFQ